MPPSAPLAAATSDDRVVPMRLRPDIAVVSAGGGRWNVYDPVVLRYYQFDEPEYLVLRLLDGNHTLKQIQEAVERTFAPRRLALPHLQSFLAMLHREGLAIADAPGQAAHLLERQEKRRRQQRLAAWANPLAIRFPGFNPAGLLDRLYPKCRWMFTPSALALGILLIIVATLAFLTQWEALRGRLPALHELTSSSNILGLAVALALAKVLHELGHALTCRHFGGRCHEMGIMLLVFTPCLYSNVSQAWLIPEKWRRMAISAAGVFVELTLAAVCALLWMASEPGAFNALCLHMMLVCSLGTVLINANPLLRFDGYYLLSDGLEIPNLGQRATAALRQVAWRFIAGADLQEEQPRSAGERRFLLVYAVLSLGYRLVLTAGILWVVYRALAPHGLTVIAQALTLVVIGTMTIPPFANAAAYFRDPGRSIDVNWRRVMLVGGLFAGGAVVVGSIPLPYRVVSHVTVEPRNSRRVFVPVTGVLNTAAAAGQSVSSGDVIASLSNPQLEIELARAEERCEEQRLLVEHLKRQQIADAKAGNELPTAQEILRDLQKLRDQRREEFRRLTIVAPQAGVIFPPPTQRPADANETAASTPPGSPLDESSRGRTLDVGTLLCLVGDTSTWDAIAVVDESSIPLVRVDQPVRVQVDALPDVILSGIVREIAESKTREISPELVAAGHVRLTARDDSGHLADMRYQVRIELTTPHPSLMFGGTGRAKITVEPRSLGRRLMDVFRQTFSLSR